MVFRRVPSRSNNTVFITEKDSLQFQKSKEGIWLQNGRLTLRWQHGFHLHDICVLCPVPALTAMQSPWAAAVGRTNLTLTFPGGVKCKVRSVKCSELPFLLF